MLVTAALEVLKSMLVTAALEVLKLILVMAALEAFTVKWIVTPTQHMLQD